MPSYYSINDSVTNKQSIMNKLVFTPNSDVSTRVVILMYAYILVAYALIYKFSKNMAAFGFSSHVDYHDKFVARHTVIIRGVNRDIGTNEVARKIGKVFEQRFEKEQVISCNAYRQSKLANKIYSKVKSCEQKLKDTK